MSILARIALGFAILRGIMLTVLTVVWAAKKMQRPDIAESERALLWMVGSRSVVLGATFLLLPLFGQYDALAWVVLADAALQLFDTLLALAQGKRHLAPFPAVLCLLGACAGLVLMR